MRMGFAIPCSIKVSIYYSVWVLRRRLNTDTACHTALDTYVRRRWATLGAEEMDSLL